MQVSLVNLLIIAGALTGALVLSLIGSRIVRWRRDVKLRRHGMPVLVMPVDDLLTPPRPSLPRGPYPPRTSPASVRRLTSIEAAEVISPEESDDDVTIIPEPFVQRPTQPGVALGSRQPIEVTSEVDGSRVRFYRAEEGTLEFLPGRLEIVGGGEAGQEIHFMRPVGEDDATITFGRSEGAPLRHVQLLDPTVSRQHARLAYSGAHWHLCNMSQTNPVTLNGSALPLTGRAITLADGDRIEMGAVVFVFHER